MLFILYTGLASNDILKSYDCIAFVFPKDVFNVILFATPTFGVIWL